MIKLSVLDQSPISEGSNASEALANTVQLAQATEKMGYHRFWVAEHHQSEALAGSSPEILMAHLAANTSKIKVGSGGVMLPHYSPYKVAENFRLLEALHPNRIDLGVGRAPGGMPLATMALQEGKQRTVNQFPEQIDDVLAYIHDDEEEKKQRFSRLKATPLGPTAPELWMLGSSGESAVLAANKGLPYTFAHFINGQGGSQFVEHYNQAFKPSKYLKEPKTIVAIFVICADTDEEAERIAKSLDLSLLLLEKGSPERKGVPSLEAAEAYPYSEFDLQRIRLNRKRMIVGSQSTVAHQLLQLRDQYSTDELMVVTITHDIKDKIYSYQLLAEAFQL
ncbi:LLM class flavin-dependent oxidoreductase [Chengkuizengella axinellae]|uniref:LLM class flavin-dependent oxidoreductase n=1 Tax=Chengkuizengella axinellae TaxID=3064388 RepID=A0ABT9IV14_9BACL|nr:LLM class flavin-dependent oxidoreductase [Chengkuizengella sp. 2205SS18-9]MDP5273185.1 LLM class flavin-dependent oxidoreductase [Chengkuizengella sp. 2205SS18-9]